MTKKTEKKNDQKDGAMPTQEQVIEWTKKDLVAAHYFLGMLLQHPEMISVMGKEIYDYAMTKKLNEMEKAELKPETI